MRIDISHRGGWIPLFYLSTWPLLRGHAKSLYSYLVGFLCQIIFILSNFLCQINIYFIIFIYFISAAKYNIIFENLPSYKNKMYAILFKRLHY